MTTVILAQTAQELAEDSGGFTLDPLSGLQPARGFAVGGLRRSERIPFNDRSSYGIEEYIEKNKSALTDGYGFLGGYVEDDELVLDVCSVEDDKEAALRIAALSKEESIFDLGTLTVIFV